MGAVFVLICALGVVAGISPTTCSGVLRPGLTRTGSGSKGTESDRVKALSREGHHPSCEGFRDHVFEWRGRRYCAGCTGLVIGALVSIVGTLSVFSIGLQVPGTGAEVFWVGFAGVAMGLLRYRIPWLQSNRAHLAFNLVFVSGAFMLFVGLDQLAGNAIIQAFFLFLSLYWIMTRIWISKEEHARICLSCGNNESCGLHDWRARL